MSDWRRQQELLEANNREMERRRAFAALLREAMPHVPGELYKRIEEALANVD